MFVLQVGIGKYKYAPLWAELRGAVTDVVEMRKVLEGERWQIPPANIVTLTDAEGTKSVIFEKFQNHLIARAKAYNERTNRRDAVVMFQFSGHGSQAPDTDGDEKDDHKDETLVTHDSQDLPGKNVDITDDEIYALTSQLKRWTDNIVYIFDSCHSGSGTRSADEVRRLPERKNPVVAVRGFEAVTRSATVKASDGNSGVLPPGDDYIVITAARANELASQKNCFEECGATKRPIVYGNLTFYLIDELRNARADTSYRELMESVTRRVRAEKPTQTPQIEGDKSRFVFSGLGRAEDNFIRIKGPETKSSAGVRVVTVTSGAMQGVTAGTIVSFYEKAVTRFDGAPKIASGTVLSVSAGESKVRVLESTRALTADDKAVIVSPDLGSLKLKVNLTGDVPKLSAGQKDVLSRVEQRIKPYREDEPDEVTPASPAAVAAGRWDVAVLKDKYSLVAEKIGGRAGCENARGKPAGDSEVFYIAGKDFVPLYGFCISAEAQTPAEQSATAKRLAEALVHIARVRAISAISNKRSVLNGKITVRPVQLIPPFRCEDGRFVAGSSVPAVIDRSTNYYQFTHGDMFWLEVTNNSPFDLYVALMYMPSDGSVKLLSPRERADEKDGILIPKGGGKRILMSDQCRVDSEGNFLESGAFLVSHDGKLDRFKLLASVDVIKREDLAYLQIPALGAKRGRKSTLAASREWTTVETNLYVKDTAE